MESEISSVSSSQTMVLYPAETIEYTARLGKGVENVAAIITRWLMYNVLISPQFRCYGHMLSLLDTQTLEPRLREILDENRAKWKGCQSTPFSIVFTQPNAVNIKVRDLLIRVAVPDNGAYDPTYIHVVRSE